MKFKYEREEDLNKFPLVPAGVYDFEVLSAIDDVSKSSGNEMIKLKIKFWDADGKEHIVFDYLLEAFKKKLKHFCENTGLTQKYESGEILAEDVCNKCGVLKLGISPAKGDFPERNNVVDYLPKDLVPKQTQQSSIELNDELPF